MPQDRMRILLTTEGTYPFHQGGVATWCDQLVHGLGEHDFYVLSLIANPNARSAYATPSNAEVLPVPLWGTEYLEEFFPLERPWRRHTAAEGRSIETQLLPALSRVVDGLFLEPEGRDSLVDSLVQIAVYCETNDYLRAMHHPATWELLLDRLRSHPLYRRLPLDQALDAGKAVWRSLSPVAYPLPTVDLTHATAAAFCALPCILAKRRFGIPFILTEHGVYLRERILALIRARTSTMERVLLTNFYRAIVTICYEEADLIAPVCEFNTRWENQISPDLEPKIEVIHNGVDVDAFAVTPDGPEPVVAFVGRIDPLKDIDTLMRAMVLVRDQVPDARLEIWGTETDPAYGVHCRRLAAELRLGAAVVFKGYSPDVPGILSRCRVVAISSVSEGMPLSLLEAMASAKPVVATAVGAIPDVLGTPEWLVDPRDFRGMAAALVRLLSGSESERTNIGLRNRERVSDAYGLDAFLAAYRDVYDTFRAPQQQEIAVVPSAAGGAA